VGGEAQVFAGAEFTRFRPWVVVVESPDPEDPQACPEWETELTQTGYQRVSFDGLNLFYVAAEKATLLGPAFGSPPNWLDNYVLGAQSNLEAEVERHRGLLPGWQSQRERILQLEREFADTIAVLERERAETRALRAAYEAVARN
jgi:hypothetical protein